MSRLPSLLAKRVLDANSVLIVAVSSAETKGPVVLVLTTAVTTAILNVMLSQTVVNTQQP